MKLKGTLTEQRIRENLTESHFALFETERYSTVRNVLMASFPDMKTAYFLEHIPEQGEDIYTLLIDTDTIVEIEINRFDKDQAPSIELISFKEFRFGLSRINSLCLEIAIDLAKKDIGRAERKL